MKKKMISGLLVLILALSLLPVTAFAADVAIDAENFYDDAFRGYVADKLDTDRSGTLSAGEIAAVKKISVPDMDITTMKGVEFFTALEELDCSGNMLRVLDVSSNKSLKRLHCEGNILRELDVSNNTSLKYLWCFDNALRSLTLGANKQLTYLNCSKNTLKTLDVSKNTGLKFLHCDETGLTELDIRSNTLLAIVNLQDTNVEKLDISNCPRLVKAYLKGEKSGPDGGYVTYFYREDSSGSGGRYYLYLDSDTEIICLNITGHPASRTVAAGKTVSFRVATEGKGLKYQWYEFKKGASKWMPMPGKTSAKLTITAKKTMNGNKYRCRVSNSGTVKYSKSAKLTVVTKPRITAHPLSVRVAAGKTVTFRVKATGGALKYQWYVMKTGDTKWAVMKGKTAASLKLTAKKPMNGYRFRCLVRNAAGRTYTRPARLTVK